MVKYCKILYLTYYLLEYRGKKINKEDWYFYITRYFKSVVGYLFIIKGGFILVAMFFKLIIIRIYVSGPTKIKGMRVSDFQCTSKDCHFHFLFEKCPS